MGDEKKKSPDAAAKSAPENASGGGQSGLPAGGIVGLGDYYANRKLTADRFLHELKKNRIEKFPSEDVGRVTGQLDEFDPVFSKTLDLLYRATAKRHPLTNDCVSFAAEAIRQQLSRHYALVLDLEVSAREVFLAAVSGLEKAVTAKRTDVRAFNLMRAAAIWLSVSRNIDLLDEVEILGAHLLRSKLDHSALKVGMSILFRPAAKLKATRDMLVLASLGSTKAKEADDAAVRERQMYLREHGRADQLARDLEQKQMLLSERDATIAALQAQASELAEQIEALGKKIDSDLAVTKHDRAELAGRARVFLDRTILPLLTTAHEFAELDPPRKATIIEKLNMAMEKIKEEIRWLGSSG